MQTQERKEKTEANLEKCQSTLKNHRNTLSQNVQAEIEERLTVLQHRRDELNAILTQTSNAKAKRVVQRIKLSLIETNRLKRRKTGAGPKLKLLPEDEDFISQCIEEHASVDGRRKQDVLYFARCLKQKDLLSVVNYHLLQTGRRAIKSAKTIMSRARPHNTRSIQAKKNHRGNHDLEQQWEQRACDLDQC